MRLALIAGRRTSTNEALARALGAGDSWELLNAHHALGALRAGDGALGRLDVLPTLDGVEDGLWALGALAARGVIVLNDAAALLATHDKLLTARLLRRNGVAHPATAHIREGRPMPAVPTPVVLKPRFGSGGSDVYRCDDLGALSRGLDEVRDRSWFRQHGALVQELVEPRGYDLRVLVATDRVVGGVYRIAPAGEWRTNVALGAVRRPVDPPPEAASLALAAARATGAALVGVDLLPTADRRWTVVELNGAVEFNSEYSEWSDVFEDCALLLDAEVRARRTLLTAA